MRCTCLLGEDVDRRVARQTRVEQAQKGLEAALPADKDEAARARGEGLGRVGRALWRGADGGGDARGVVCAGAAVTRHRWTNRWAKACSR